jgi:hypothetical protein
LRLLPLRKFPPTSDAAGNKKERRTDPEEHRDLRPERGDREVAPEYLGEAIDGPGIDGEQASFLHGRGHEEPGKHAAAN